MCKNIEEDGDGNLQGQNIQHPQQNIPHKHKAHSSHHRKISNAPRPKTTSNHRTSSTPNLLMYLIIRSLEWEEKMERLNDKNGLDYYSSSESESDWDEEEPKYETSI